MGLEAQEGGGSSGSRAVEVEVRVKVGLAIP